MNPNFITFGLLILILLLVIVLLLLVRRRRTSSEPEKAKAGKPKGKGKKKGSKKAAIRREGKRAPKPESKTAKPVDASAKILGDSPVKPAAPPATDYTPAGDKIRILIVDDNTGTRENVSRLLYFEDDLEVIGQAVNGRHGVEMSIELKPHIVLMDINMPDMDGITATNEMALKAPFSQVIIMSVQADQHYMKRAMAAGARDFQPKPFTSEELVSCIRRVYRIGLPIYEQLSAIEKTEATQQETPESAEAKSAEGGTPIIAVFSPKGGVGTSAIAANIAATLHLQRGDAVLMDGSLQFGDISVHLNTRSPRTVSDLVHEGQLEADLMDDVVVAHTSGLKLLLAPPQPELAEAINSAMLPEILGTLQRQFKTVVVDTASKLTDKTLVILEKADYILLVTNPDLMSIKSAKLFLELAERLEFDPDRLIVVINRVGIPGGVKAAQIKKVLKLERTHHIPLDAKLHFSLNKGNPVCLEDPSSPSSIAIKQLARQLSEQLPEPEPQVDPTAR